MATKLNQIGKLISQLREHKKITQGNLAELMGTTHSAIARIENGEQARRLTEN